MFQIGRPVPAGNLDNGKLVVRRGRKAMGLVRDRQTATERNIISGNISGIYLRAGGSDNSAI
jgi:hypothetical protein